MLTSLILVALVAVYFVWQGKLKFWHDSGLVGPFLVWTPEHQFGGFFKVDHGGLRYLSRWILYRRPGLRIFLHHIHRPDQDRHLHNHPWEAQCLILWGGYREWRTYYTGSPRNTESMYEYHIGDVNTLPRTCYHRITEVRPNTWSLVFAGPRYREWHFLVDGEPMEWREYLGLPKGTRIAD